jgi:CHASE2 domain-containing sensor protein
VLLAGAVAAVAGLALDAGGALDRQERDTVDLRFRLRADKPPNDVAVVAIDDVTFSDLRRQWPFPRALHARAVTRLAAAHPRVIAYDVQFTEPTTPAQDFALYDAIGRAGGAVLATSESDDRGRTNVLGGDAQLARIHSRAAATNLPTDAGGEIRRFPYAHAGLQSMAVAVARRAGRPVDRADFDHGEALIDYRGPPGTIPTYSFSDLVRGRIPADRLRGKVVVVGASAPTLQDVHPVPTAPDELMSGPEVQASAIWTAMHGFPLHDAPGWIGALLIALLGFAPAVAGLRLRPPAIVLGAAVLGAAYLGAAQLAFDSGWIVAVVAPLVALAAGAIAMIVTGYVAEATERRRVALHNEELEREVLARTEELRETQLEVIARLGQAAESRDEDTGAHIERMSRLCRRLGLEVGMSPAEAEVLRQASAMHDVGKIGIPDRVLRKAGPLDREERSVMQSHTTIGASILTGSRSPLVRMAEAIARTHHERWDGSGYPAGLRGEEIPLEGRICAICDVFDALLSARAYKDAWSADDAVAEIARGSGTQFDPRLVEAFLRVAPELEREMRADHGAPAGGDGAGPPAPADAETAEAALRRR